MGSGRSNGSANARGDRRRVRPWMALLAGMAVLTTMAAATAAGRPTSGRASIGQATGANTTTPPIRHVWIIELENNSYSQSFGDLSADPYLATTLPSEGALLRNYYGIGHDSLDNYIAEVSGQAPTFQTGQDCEYFTQFFQFEGENFSRWTKDGQLSGDGCVYPPVVQTVGNQLSKAGLTWKAYEQDMGNDPHRDGTTTTSHGPACGHPKLNHVDLTDTTGPANDSYATRHDPFMYFHSIIDHRAYCDAHVVTLTPLAEDLRSVATTPNYSFITPNTCSDAHDVPRCQDGTKGGLGRADAFLQMWVPRITASPAYRQGGLIVVTFDESGEDRDATACCGEALSLGYTDPAHPNVNEPGLYGPGGGRVGAVLLSPFIAGGTVSALAYNHYSLLRSVEDLFGLSHLGDAQEVGVASFGSDVYTNWHAPA